MPLVEKVPSIDDRKFDDILREIRARIPRYTPEWRPAWNDLNDNDPGMMLSQVFAWLSEMMLYRMGRVPELNYIKFLELIGVELTPALPAKTEVTFAVEDALLTAAAVDVPPRTQVSAQGEDGKPVVFETLRAVRALACSIVNIQSDDSAQYRDLTTENAAASPFMPLHEMPREGAAFNIGLKFPAGHTNENDFPALTLELAMFAATTSGATLSHSCGPLALRAFAPARVQWEGWDGARWLALDLLNDETLAFTRSGHVWVRVPQNVKLARDFLGAYEDGVDPATGTNREKLFWIRARVEQPQYERTPRLLAVRTNTVPAEEAQTVNGEILGGSDGRRNQTWQFGNTPVIRGSVQIQIDDGTGAANWEVLDDLFGSGPDDRQIAVNYTSGQVRAGDGENGDIPVANADNPNANVIAVSYRHGGGVRGNVAAKALNNLLTPVDGIDGGKTENLFAAVGGTDEELLDAAKRRARMMLRARDRAVTPEDFEMLAQAAGNVKRAKALPLAHPQFPGVKVPGAITVIIVPDADASVVAPSPSDGLLRLVCAYLDARRLLTSEVYVVAPRYVEVEVDAQIVVTDDADPGAVREAVERVLADYFHALRGGDDGQGWPFGGAMRYSKIVQRVFSVPGVDSVPRLVLTVEGQEQPECRDVDLFTYAPQALVHLTRIAVEPRSLIEEGANA
jgi:predicted phage baseplate assembly protein